MTVSDEDGTWTLGVIESPVRVICRWRSDLTVPDPDRPVKVTVRVGFKDARQDGMPVGAVENDYLAAIEEALVRELPVHGAVLTLVVTGEGNREWVAYSPSPSWLTAWSPAFADRWLRDRAAEIRGEADPAWSTYKTFSGVGADQPPSRRRWGKGTRRERPANPLASIRLEGADSWPG
jgi:hypothetical protein